MTESTMKTDVIPLAPYFFLKAPNNVEKSILEFFSQGNFFLHQTGPGTTKILYLLNRFSGFFKNALRIYVPAHLVILILRLRSRKDSKATLLKKYLTGVLRSSIFVAFFAMSIAFSRVAPPLYGIFNNSMGSWSGFTISFLFSCFIFLESSSRWADLALYVLGQWFEAFPKSLVKRHYLPPVKHTEKLLLAISIGLMVWLRFDEDPVVDHKKNKMSSAVDFLIGKFEDDEKAKLICGQVPK